VRREGACEVSGTGRRRPRRCRRSRPVRAPRRATTQTLSRSPCESSHSASAPGTRRRAWEVDLRALRREHQAHSSRYAASAAPRRAAVAHGLHGMMCRNLWQHRTPPDRSKAQRRAAHCMTTAVESCPPLRRHPRPAVRWVLPALARVARSLHLRAADQADRTAGRHRGTRGLALGARGLARPAGLEIRRPLDAWPALLQSCQRPAVGVGRCSAARCSASRRTASAELRDWLGPQRAAPTVSSPTTAPRAAHHRLLRAAGGRATRALGCLAQRACIRRRPTSRPVIPTGRAPASFARCPRRRPRCAGREIAWLADPLDVLVLHIQGSGRCCASPSLDGGAHCARGVRGQQTTSLTVGGALAHRAGELQPARRRAAIRDWAALIPRGSTRCCRANPRLRVLPRGAAARSVRRSRGAQGVPLTPGARSPWIRGACPTDAGCGSIRPSRSQAPLAATAGARAGHGSAITGPIARPILLGLGLRRREQAGRMRQPLRMWVLLAAALESRPGRAGHRGCGDGAARPGREGAAVLVQAALALALRLRPRLGGVRGGCGRAARGLATFSYGFGGDVCSAAPGGREDLEGAFAFVYENARRSAQGVAWALHERREVPAWAARSRLSAISVSSPSPSGTGAGISSCAARAVSAESLTPDAAAGAHRLRSDLRPLTSGHALTYCVSGSAPKRCALPAKAWISRSCNPAPVHTWLVAPFALQRRSRGANL